MHRLIITALLLTATPALAASATNSSPIDTPVSALKPGQWIWDDMIAPAGPMLVIVNLSSQRAFAYRNGIRIGATTISSGKAGKTTPTGVFTILQKNKDHKSNLYNSAPMPYMQRLTWDGIAMHAGNLPGYPASHGCVRLPLEFSKLLFQTSLMGMTVVVTDSMDKTPIEPEMVTENAFLAPISAQGVAADPRAEALSAQEVSRWEPQKSPEGPVTIVLSTTSKRILVYRNGVIIGRTRIGVTPGFEIGTRAAQFAGRDAQGVAQWVYLGLPGYQERQGQHVEQDAIKQVTIPPQFYAQMRSVVGEGTTLLATDGGMVEGSTGQALKVLESDK